MTITPKAIEEKVFSNAHLAAGYAKKEVDSFLNEVKVELHRAQELAAASNLEVRRLLNLQPAPATVQITPVPSTSNDLASVTLAPVESSITKILQRGQQLADELVADGKVEAEKLKAEAQVEIDKARADVAAEVEKLKADAVAELTKLQADAASLASTNSTAAKILQNALTVLSPASTPSA